jgi:1-aminocyclopropane-1-carboxylate synthase
VWLDLASYLPLSETGGDGWEAERLLNRRFRQEGVLMATGEAYLALTPGHFRLIFCLGDEMLREGIKRYREPLKSDKQVVIY